jgi:gliding motility-associated-like protein
MLVGILRSQTAFAQPGCPNITCGPNQAVDCNTTCVDLTATVLETGASTSYTVSSVPFAPPAPFTGGIAQFINTDDIWGSVINLPFNFCFYGNQYSQVVIGANGLITFDVTQANQFCAWSYTASCPTPGPPPGGLYNNSIMGAYHDIDPSVEGEISYFIQGSAPCRMFVVSFDNVAHYDCDCTGIFGGECRHTTQQIVLYETTNVIEVYIEQKETCSSWNSGNAVIGIQDATGANGTTPPGRNTGPWSANNEGWRFTPSGAPNFEVNWYDGGTLVGTGTTVNVCPSATTTYDAEAVYTNCDGTVVTVTDQVTVTQNSSVSVSVAPTMVNACSGDVTTLTASSPNPGMNYTWSPATGLSATTGTTVDASPNSTTVYTVTGYDGNCFASATATINISEIILDPSSTDATCAGNDGTAAVTPSGGAAPYTYGWNTVPVQTTQTATGLAAGDYDVTVEDAGGCTATETITVSLNLTALTPPTMTSTDAVCSAENGTATATPVDGNAPFTYLWDDPNAQTTQTATDLATGTYTVVLTDAGGCESTNTVVVGLDQGSITTAINVFNNISCNGLCDGDATVDVQNGTAPLNFLWDDPNNQMTQTASNLCAGTFNVGVQDANGCLATAQVVITEPTALSASAVMDQQSTCGNADGAATATGNGGTVAIDYGYSWSSTPVQTTASATGLLPATYTVTVSDDNGCTATADVDITSTLGFTANIQSSLDATCFQGCDGEATAGFDALAAQPVTYLWNDPAGQTTQTATGLCAGTYDVTLTDAGGCLSTATVTIQEPQAINTTLSASASPICIGQSSDLTAIVTGGVQPYLGYAWIADPADPSLNATEQNPTVSPEVTTTYTFTAIDANGCISPPKFVTVEVLPPLTLDVIRPTFSPDTGICPYDFAVIHLQGNGGDGNYTYFLNPDLTTPLTLPMQVQPGTTTTYDFTVVDGCTTPPANASSTITVFQLPAVNFAGDVLSGCHIHTVNFTDQTTPTPVSWSWNFGDTGSGANTSNQQNPTHEFSGAGLYSVSLEVESADGCVNDTTYSDYIEVYPLPYANFQANPEQTNVLQATVEFTDLSAPDIETWNWNFGNGDESTLQNPVYTYVDTGVFTVWLTVETVHGCTDDVSHVVEVDPDVMFYIPNTFTPNNDGRNDYFRPYGEGVKWETFEMFIYDRWGEEIYYTTDIDSPWRGWYKDREVEVGVYVYMIRIFDQNGEQRTYRDHVTLLR